jgi:SAM-dependent methyltransferase
VNCPLCSSAKTFEFSIIKDKKYYRCRVCSLIYLDSKNYISEKEEKTIYDYHENNPDDLNYRKFLSRLAEPLEQHLPKNAKGLDFGCGPGPTLSLMFEEKEHEMRLFDKFYHPDESILSESYDFIVMTEVIEHLKNPSFVLNQLHSLLKERGYLGIMTKLYSEKIDFKKWYYATDPTHICFYSKETFRWLCGELPLKLLFSDQDNVVILGKD